MTPAYPPPELAPLVGRRVRGVASEVAEVAGDGPTFYLQTEVDRVHQMSALLGTGEGRRCVPDALRRRGVRRCSGGWHGGGGPAEEGHRHRGQV